MLEWQTNTVESCLVRLPLGAIRKLQTQDYHRRGRYPIIDQGQALIAGWTDDESGVIALDSPVIVFGDHTRALKFVDFPFVRGADGTQILKPKSGIDPLFFYYALRALDLPSRGYNRHFKSLKEKEVSLPPDAEQFEIAQVLKLVEGALNLQVEELKTLARCKQTAMRSLFAHGLHDEGQKESDLGAVPESWKDTTLGFLCDRSGGWIQTGPFGSQLHAHEYVTDGVPVINPTHLAGNRISHEKVPRVDIVTADRLARHKVEPGDILFGRRGEIGRHGLVSDAEAGWLCGTGCFVVHVREPEINNEFLSHFFSTENVVSWLAAHAAGAIMPNLNGVVLSRLPVIYPDINEQHEIVAILDALDRKIDLHKRKRAVLDLLFKSLLQKLMNGKIHVSDLDLSILDAPKVLAEVVA